MKDDGVRDACTPPMPSLSPVRDLGAAQWDQNLPDRLSVHSGDLNLLILNWTLSRPASSVVSASSPPPLTSLFEVPHFTFPLSLRVSTPDPVRPSTVGPFPVGPSADAIVGPQTVPDYVYLCSHAGALFNHF